MYFLAKKTNNLHGTREEIDLQPPAGTKDQKNHPHFHKFN